MTLPATAPEHVSGQHLKGVSRILGPKWARLPIITVGLLGVQMMGSVGMAYAAPYLLSLGLSKSGMAAVFVAGPLSGLIMQPLIGVLADSCTSSFGRRRPYILLGTVICVLAMLLLGFTRTVASIFTTSGSHANNVTTMWLAILAIFLIDFAINAVMASDRALLVDTVPSSEQASGNAWAARMVGIGGLMGFFVGYIDLPHTLPFLGNSQLQVLSVIACLGLITSHLFLTILVKERVLVQDSSVYKKSFAQDAKDLWNNLFTLPKVIRLIFMIQFLACAAWYPLTYSTVYVNEIYKRSVPAPTTEEQQTLIDEAGTRLASRAFFYSALLSLAITMVLPAFVAEAAGHSSSNQTSSRWTRVCHVPRGMQVHLVTIWATSHLVFAGCMFATSFTDSVRGAILIITITGFSAAISSWAPFSLLSEAILTEPITHDDEISSIHLVNTHTWPQRQQALHTEEQEERDVLLEHGSEDEDEDEESELKHQRRDSGTSRSDSRVVSSTLSSKAGIILGIHNVFIVIPQFLVTGLATIVFAIFDTPKRSSPDLRAPIAPGSTLNDTVSSAHAVVARGKGVLESLLFDSNSIQGRAELDGSSHSDSLVYLFRISGVAACLAFFLSCWLAREIRRR